MARELNDIIAHIRAACANPAIKTTLIRTDDLLALCDAAECPLAGVARGSVNSASPFVLSCMEHKPDWKAQSFEYYAAHFLVGSGLVGSDLDANVRGLAHELRKQYDLGVDHGATVEAAPV